MIITVLILLLMVFAGAKFAKPEQFHGDYLSKETTTSINGIFVILVFLRHFSQYVTFSSEPVDKLFVVFNSFIGQLIVTTFMFYSGYGIMLSIAAKGSAYVSSIPKKRIFSVWLHFFIAVLLFCVTNLFIGKKYSLETVLLSYIGWSSVGNSNWYIFAILFLYLFVFIAFKICRNKPLPSIIITSVLIIAFVYVMMLFKRPAYTYNVLACYPMGMLYALLKDKIEGIIMKNDLLYSLALALAFGMAVLTCPYRNDGFIPHSIWSMIFVALVVLLSMKLKLNNGLLQFLGSHVFGIYILQRIPMIIFKELGLHTDKTAFLILTFLITVVMTLIFDKLMFKLDKKLKIA